MGFALSSMALTSQSFPHGGLIPDRYIKEGDNVSPQLQWQNAPAEAKSFVVFCHDPDAPLVTADAYGFVHWVLYNIPASTSTLAENSAVGTAGVNDFGEQGWGGPQPPNGHGKHHYFFWLMALDTELALPAGLSLSELLPKVEPHVIAMNRMLGCFENA